jgi:hypothetical protein
VDIIGVGALNLDFIYETEDLSYIKVAGLDIEEGKEIIGKEDTLSCLKDKLNRFGVLRKVSPYKKENFDIDSVIKLSEKMRKEVRGQVEGSLG